MPTIINGVGKKRIKEICEKHELNWKEKSMLSRILQGWDKVVDKADKLKIVDEHVGKDKKDCVRVIRALVQINKEYGEKMAKKGLGMNLQDDMTSNVRG